MSTDNPYNVGDQVVLLSGGPVMTVNSVVSRTHVHAAWFAGKKLETGNFAVAALKRAEEGSDEKKN